MANPLDFLKSTNYPSSFLEGTFGDKFYKSVVEPAKLGTGPKPTIGQVTRNWNPLKAFTPQMLATGPTPAASRFLGSNIAYGAPFAYASAASALQKKLEEQGLTGKGGIYDISGGWGAMGAGADVEYDFQNQRAHFQNQKAQRFKQQQLMNRRKQDMQQQIRQGEAAEAAKQKAAADAAARAEKDRQASLQAQVTAQANKAAQQAIAGGAAPDYGKTETRASSGWESSPFAKGGLVDLYRHGGFSG